MTMERGLVPYVDVEDVSRIGMGSGVFIRWDEHTNKVFYHRTMTFAKSLVSFGVIFIIPFQPTAYDRKLCLECFKYGRFAGISVIPCALAFTRLLALLVRSKWVFHYGSLRSLQPITRKRIFWYSDLFFFCFEVMLRMRSSGLLANFSEPTFNLNMLPQGCSSLAQDKHGITFHFILV